MLVHGHSSHANARIHRKSDNGDVKKKETKVSETFVWHTNIIITIGGSLSKRSCGSHGVGKIIMSTGQFPRL